MSENVVQLRRKPRPLRKTYRPLAPYEVERQDDEDGEIIYEVWDYRPDSYRRVAQCSDDHGMDPYAKFNMEQTARGLNMLVQYGLETLPDVREQD